MNLNLPILLDELKNVRSFHCDLHNTERKLYTFSSYVPNLELRSDILYLLSAPEIPALPEDSSCSFLYLLSDREDPPPSPAGNYAVITVSSEYGLPEIIQDLENAFRKYSLLEQELTDALLKKSSVAALCSLAIKVFQNPILVHNPEYKVLAAVETDTARFSYPVREPHTGYMFEALVKDLIFRSDYLDTFNYTTPQYWLDDDDKTLSLYMNLFDDSGQYIGRMIIDEMQKFGYGAESLMAFFVGFLEAALRSDTIKKLDTPQIFKNSCLEYLNGTSSLRKEELKTELILYGWMPLDTYFCINIQAPPRNIKMHVTPYESLIFGNYIRHCLTLDYQDELLLIFNLSKSGQTREDACEQIIYLVRENLLSAGISTEFSDFFDFPDYYRQAKAARLTGTRFFPTQWLFKFESVALKHATLPLL